MSKCFYSQFNVMFRNVYLCKRKDHTLTIVKDIELNIKFQDHEQVSINDLLSRFLIMFYYKLNNIITKSTLLVTGYNQ